MKLHHAAVSLDFITIIKACEKIQLLSMCVMIYIQVIKHTTKEKEIT